MFYINNLDKLEIGCTRGDIGVITVSANKSKDELYTFMPGEKLRLLVYEKKKPENVVLLKDVEVEHESTEIEITLSKDDTKIGPLISKPSEYWYEITLNPDTMPQTIIGYDSDGPKLFILYPEGGDE